MFLGSGWVKVSKGWGQGQMSLSVLSVTFQFQLVYSIMTALICSMKNKTHILKKRHWTGIMNQLETSSRTLENSLHLPLQLGLSPGPP